MAYKDEKAPVYVLGMPLDPVTPDEAVGIITSALEDGGFFAVVTPNPTMIMAAQREPGLAQAIKSADLRLADGVGVVDAARRAGTPLPARVTGVDTGRAVLEKAAGNGTRVWLLGGKAGVAEEAAARLKRELPGLTVAGTADGYFDEEDSAELIGRITAAGTELLIVCLGSPRQEIWVMEHAAELSGVRVAMTLGGSLDVWSGNARRAPGLLCRMKLEWLWRMCSQPRRFAFIPDMVRFRLKTGRHRREGSDGDS